MSNVSFTQTLSVRGSITNVRTGYFYRFELNPQPVDDPWGANMAEDPIPGFSDPYLRFASGKLKTVSFKLFMDGEITIRKFGQQFGNGLQPQRDLQNSYSISGAVEFFQSLTQPTDPTESGADGGLDRCVFAYGSHWAAVQCFVKEANFSCTMLDVNLEPIKGTMHLRLDRVVDTNTYSNQIWSPP